MRRSRAAAAAGAALVVVVGVLAVRGGTAVDAGDLAQARAAATAAAEEPSAAPSVPPGEAPIMLSANGLPGMRLGAAVEGLATHEGLVPLGDGEDAPVCDVAYPDTAEPAGDRAAELAALWDLSMGVQVSAWVVDDVVQSVRLEAFGEPVGGASRLRSWTGVTLGSPIEAAEELPGARTTRERPWPDGPTVTVVRLPLQGGGTELVVADTPRDQRVAPGALERRVTTLEVRTAVGAACTRGIASLPLFAGSADPDGAEGTTQVAADGSVGEVRVGAAVAPLVATGDLEPDGDDGGRCAWLRSADGAFSVVAHEGVVSRLDVRAPFTVEGGFASSSTAADLLAGPLGDRVSVTERFSANASAQVSPERLEDGTTYVDLGDVLLELWFQPASRPVPEVGTFVSGGEAVANYLTIRPPLGGDVDPYAC